MPNTLTLAASIVVAHGQMVEYENSESYPVGTSIHLQGADTVDGEVVPRWYAQDDFSILRDWNHDGEVNAEDLAYAQQHYVYGDVICKPWWVSGE